MFRWLQSRILWGSILIIGGIALLLQNVYGIQLANIFWCVIFAFGGLIFLGVFLANRENWWALIPGFVLISIGVMLALEWLVPGLNSDLGGFIVLAGIALAFFIIYLVDNAHWWAIIPGGVLATVAVFVLLENIWAGFGGPGVFFVGLGLTFFLLAIVPTPEGRMKWAWIPGVVLTIVGFIIIAVTEEVIVLLWPVALILLGLVLIIRFFLSR